MWKLTIMDDEGKQTQLPLSRGEYAIGRAEENTVRLTDRNISRKHLVLRRNSDQGWMVEDLESYNGCFVNGMRVSGTHPLYHGDLLQLGDYRLELQDESAGAEAEHEHISGPVSTLLDRPDRLVAINSVIAGTEYPLEGERIIVGRAEEADISINHSSVSRTHAEIVNLGNGIYEVFDRGSSNGLRVNGTKVERWVIEDDDEIELGDIRLRFVAQGRIFRPGTLTRGAQYTSSSEQLAHPGQRRRGLGAMIIVGAALGILAVVGFAALRTTDDQAPSGASAERLAHDQAILEEAKRLSAAEEHDAAHEELAKLPEGSPLRDSAVVKEIEGKWADDVFARAATNTDASRRRSLLQQVSSAPLVDAERRKRAADMIAQLDTDGTSVGDLPVAVAKTKEAGGEKLLAPNPFDTTKTSAPKSTKTSTTSPPATTAAPPATTGATADNAREAVLSKDNERARSILEQKVWSGRASEDEIKLLRAICRQQRDSACAQKCSAMLKARQER